MLLGLFVSHPKTCCLIHDILKTVAQHGAKKFIDDANENRNMKCIEVNYAVWEKVIINNEVMDYKAGDKHVGPLPILQVQSNNTART